MTMTVSDFLIQRLNDWALRRIYGFPGDGINGIIGAIGRAGDKVDYVQVRHEEMSAFMACAHSKFTGEVGVCLATSGPGAIHLLNGLYDAKMDHQSVVAIVGQQGRMALGGNYQQEVDLISLFKDVAGEYVHMATVPSQIRHLVDRAVRIAKAERTVTCIIIPNDLQELPYEEPPRIHGALFSGVGFCKPRVVPSDADLRRAADVLNSGKKVAILVGAGALGATDEVLEVAELLGAGISKALLGKAVIPDEAPGCCGSIGLLGTKPSWDMMMGCDTLLMIGSSFPYSEFLPKEGQARGVQIEIDGKMPSIRYPMEVPLVGDSLETLKALIPLLTRKTDRTWREKIEKGIADWWKVLEAQAMNEANPINPQRVFWELSPRLPENCILSSDSGSSANWFARDLKIRRGMMASLSGNLATMGPGVPYAIAAKFAWPNRVAIALVGDGAMLMNGINGLVTIAKYWKEWSNPSLIIMVLANHDLNQVTWEQRVMVGDAKFAPSQDVPDFHFAQYAELLGLKGIRVDEPNQIGAAWDEALAAKMPVVIEAVTDPDVPTLPPHITFKEAMNFSKSLLHDPARGGMFRGAMKDMIETLIPHKGEMDWLATSLYHAAAMLWEMLWALVLGFAISATLQVFVSKKAMVKAFGKNGLREVLLAMAFGAASSSCSYAAAATTKTVFKKGAAFVPSLAFMIASTNLVVELGIVLWILMGWRFVLAEIVGAFVMVAAVWLIFAVHRPEKLIKEARKFSEVKDAEHHHHRTGRKKSKIVQVAEAFFMDWSMLWKEIIIGVLIAGFLMTLVPKSWWQNVFISDGPYAGKLIENAVVGPLIAMASFVCSVGNIPLASLLWSSGASFGGVIAFLYGDLIVLPLILAYRKYYGLRFALYITLALFVAMVYAGILVDLLFSGLGLAAQNSGDMSAISQAGFSWNYTTWLNLIAIAGGGWLFYLHFSSQQNEESHHGARGKGHHAQHAH